MNTIKSVKKWKILQKRLTSKLKNFKTQTYLWPPKTVQNWSATILIFEIVCSICFTWTTPLILPCTLFLNEWLKQLLIQNTSEQLQDKHVTKAFTWIENNSSIVLFKRKMSYSLKSYSWKLKMSWSFCKKKEKKRTFYLKKAEISLLPFLSL